MFPKKFLSRLKIKQRGTLSNPITTCGKFWHRVFIYNSWFRISMHNSPFANSRLDSKITLNICPFILLSSNLCRANLAKQCQMPLQNLQAHNITFFWFFRILKREWRINKLSKVEYPFRNPLWFSHSTINSSQSIVLVFHLRLKWILYLNNLKH